MNLVGWHFVNHIIMGSVLCMRIDSTMGGSSKAELIRTAAVYWLVSPSDVVMNVK